MRVRCNQEEDSTGVMREYKIARNIDPALQVQLRVDLVAKVGDFPRRGSRANGDPVQVADWHALSMTSFSVERVHRWTRFCTMEFRVTKAVTIARDFAARSVRAHLAAPKCSHKCRLFR